MSEPKNEKSRNYFNGGFAEIVSNPSDLTFSYLKQWFSGKNCIGSAFDLLGLPNEKVEISLLEMVDGELLVDLEIEEQTLYKNTLFSYANQTSPGQNPNLKLNWAKMFKPKTWAGTIKIILAQSRWIANPPKTVELAQSWIDKIPEQNANPSTPEELNVVLESLIWPKVLAIGALAEFYQHYLSTQNKEIFNDLSAYISQKISQKDWFFRSIDDQQKVKEGKMTFDEYLKKYGMRSDKDYELTQPRWFEIKETIEKRVKEYETVENKTESSDELYENLPAKLKTLIDCYINLQVLRSEAKRKTLPFINQLRQLLPAAKEKTEPKNITSEKQLDKNLTAKSFSKGTPVSPGEVSGKVKQIKSASDTLGDAVIGIFPNASPEFAVIYPKCKGMIFLKGGQTSHGAIVAREFHIPSLIDHFAATILDGATVSINGAKGEWRVIDVIASD